MVNEARVIWGAKKGAENSKTFMFIDHYTKKLRAGSHPTVEMWRHLKKKNKASLVINSSSIFTTNVKVNSFNNDISV